MFEKIITSISNAPKKVRDYLISGFDAPNNFKFDIAAQPLYRTIGGVKRFIGLFLPELYIMAEHDALPAQIAERQFHGELVLDGVAPAFDSIAFKNILRRQRPEVFAELYRPTFNRKSNFELAVFHPQNVNPGNGRIGELEDYVTAIYQARKNSQLGFAPFISKVRIQDYLGEANKLPAGLCFNDNDPSFEIKINLYNNDAAWYQHKLAQYIGRWLIMPLTLVASVGTGNFGLFCANFMCQLRLKDFSMFDNAEAFNREMAWVTAKDIPYIVKEKISLRNTLITVAQLAAMVAFVGTAGMMAWGAAFELPWAYLAAHTGLSAAAIHAGQYAVGAMLTATTVLTTWLAVFGTQRYLAGLSIMDNHIKFDLTEITAVTAQQYDKKGPGPSVSNAYVAPVVHLASRKRVRDTVDLTVEESLSVRQRVKA